MKVHPGLKASEDIPAIQRESTGSLANCHSGQANISQHRAKLVALQIPGVAAFVGPEDIPGENLVGLGGMDAEIFASHKTVYLHQPLGLIVAETPSLAEKAAKLVDVNYSHPKVSLLSLQTTLSFDVSKSVCTTTF